MHFCSRASKAARLWRVIRFSAAIPSSLRAAGTAHLPPFTGGAVGYFGYDMVRTIEDIPNTGLDELGIDDAMLMFYKTVLAFDHLRHQIHIISNVIVDASQEPLDIQYQKAVEEI